MAIESVQASASSEDGAKFAVDTITDSVQVPYVKLMSGADASENLIGGDATNGLDVDVTRVSGTVAVSNAGLTELAAAINASSQMDVNIAASNATVAISHAALTELAAAIDTELQVDVVAALPAGTNNIGDVDIASIAAGDNNIGNVDIASIAAGDNNIGNVDVVTLPGSAHDAAVSGNPVRVAGRAATADYTAVAAGDTADLLASTLGKLVTIPYALPGATWSYASSAAVTDTADDEAKARTYILEKPMNNRDTEGRDRPVEVTEVSRFLSEWQDSGMLTGEAAERIVTFVREGRPEALRFHQQDFE